MKSTETKEPQLIIRSLSRHGYSYPIFFGDPDSVDNMANASFLYTESCGKIIEFYKVQVAKNEQDVLDEIKAEVVTRMKVPLQFLVKAYICTFHQLNNDLNKVSTLQANL